jgi:hypothetical protein
MTITSLGYSGTIAPNVGWANMQQVLGSRYMVASHTDCVVSPLVGGTRQIQVSTGYMGGWGILDQITATETLTLATVASGIHYWLICAHRNWTTPVTTITAIDAGTALPATMPTRSTSPGTTDDQPLALVSIAAGATNPVVIYDLRAIGGPNFYNMSASLQNLPNWLSYMAIEGSTVYTGNKRWYRSVNQFTGNAFWGHRPGDRHIRAWCQQRRRRQLCADRLDDIIHICATVLPVRECMHAAVAGEHDQFHTGHRIRSGRRRIRW